MFPEDLHQALLYPEIYPGGEEGPVQFRETHVSRLYFTRDHVYKIKKPVNFGFLDFTTLERRHFFCTEEVRLNRRFAPDTYLGVLPIYYSEEGFSLAREKGEICEYAVQMKRLPQTRMLDHLLALNAPELPGEMERLGRRLAELHRESEVVRPNGDPPQEETVRFNWEENFDQSRAFIGRTLPLCALQIAKRYVERFLSAHADLLRRREEEGWVRDGHGDLHTENICLTGRLQIYDCIEFNRRFRVADIAADLAFLLMDLDFREGHALGNRLLESYRAEIGGGGPGFDLLLGFFKIYRAWVRGKVESLLAFDRAAGEKARREGERAARRYFNQALGYLCPSAMVLTCGLMGTGKSTLAADLARRTGALLLRSDEIRRELAGPQAEEGQEAAFGEGIYTPEFNRRVYDELLKRAIDPSLRGRTVVLDASFSRREERSRFRGAARSAGVPLVTVLAECSRETALSRLDARQQEGTDPSQGRRELYDPHAASFEAPEETIRVDTEKDIEYNTGFLLCEILKEIGTVP